MQNGRERMTATVKQTRNASVTIFNLKLLKYLKNYIIYVLY